MNTNKTLNKLNWGFKLLLPEYDMTSYYSCQQLVNYWKLSNKLNRSKKTLAIILYLILNTAILLYEYVYASWFLLYMTPTGFRIIKKLIYSHPIFTLFFYSSFYIRILTEPDIQKFNYISKKLGLPDYEKYNDIGKLTGRAYIRKVINAISYKFALDTPDTTIINTTNIITDVLLNQVASKIENLPYVLNYKILQDIEIKDIGAVEMTEFELKADIQFWAEETYKNIENHKEQIKKERLKTKREEKLKLQKLVERKTDSGEILCLDDCKPRVKTSSGCYCESDCGSFLGIRKNWCYIDPKKCKKGKHLQKNPKINLLNLVNPYATESPIENKHYDTCDPSKISKPICHTGFKYRPCKQT